MCSGKTGKVMMSRDMDWKIPGSTSLLYIQQEAILNKKKEASR